MKKVIYSEVPRHNHLFHPLNFARYTESSRGEWIELVSSRQVGSKSEGTAAYRARAEDVTISYERKRDGRVTLTLASRSQRLNGIVEEKFTDDSKSDIVEKYLEARRHGRNFRASMSDDRPFSNFGFED